MRRMYSENQLESKIAEVIESGTVENAKPLYFHPITIYLSSKFAFTMIIINSQAEAYTKTTLKDLLSNESTRGRYLVNGAYYGDVDGTPYYLSPSYCVYNTTQSKILLVGIASNGRVVGANDIVVDFGELITTAGTFEDEVNKIN